MKKKIFTKKDVAMWAVTTVGFLLISMPYYWDGIKTGKNELIDDITTKGLSVVNELGEAVDVETLI